jgi:predicted MFS family arabinose efflux permease
MSIQTISPAQTTDLSKLQLGMLVLGKLILNTAFRVVYPLLAFLAGAFAVDLQTASLLVTVQVGATLLSPLGGMLADTRGERSTMVLGMALFCVATLICALAPGFLLFLVGYALVGLATAIYVPANQAYASARSDYAQRGRVLGILELSWALAALLGVSTLSRLTDATNTVAPMYWVLTAFGVLTLALTLLLLDPLQQRHSNTVQERPPLRAILRANVVAGMAFVFCTLLAIELIIVVYASWLERDFGATTAQLGAIFALLGFVEIGGSLGAAIFTDRIGKRRAVISGYLLTALWMLLLPFTAGNWWLFLPIFLLYDVCFEFAVVSTFPLLSELLPQARGRVIALGVATIGLGRMIGSLLGPALFSGIGFTANGVLAALLTVVGVAICARWVYEGDR